MGGEGDGEISSGCVRGGGGGEEEGYEQGKRKKERIKTDMRSHCFQPSPTLSPDSASGILEVEVGQKRVESFPTLPTPMEAECKNLISDSTTY